MNSNFIGIDVGKDGGIAVIDNISNKISLYNIPKIKDEVDVRELYTILSKYSKTMSNSHLVMEDIHSLYGMSANSNFQFGKIAGVLEGIIYSLGIPFTLVSPKTWQKEMWQGIRPIEILTKDKNGNPKNKIDTKATSLLACKRLFPDIDLRKSERSKNPHDGLVDALLMSEYCRRKFK